MHLLSSSGTPPSPKLWKLPSLPPILFSHSPPGCTSLLLYGKGCVSEKCIFYIMLLQAKDSQSVVLGSAKTSV